MSADQSIRRDPRRWRPRTLRVRALAAMVLLVAVAVVLAGAVAALSAPTGGVLVDALHTLRRQLSPEEQQRLVWVVGGGLLLAADAGLWLVLRPLDFNVWGGDIRAGRFVALLVTAPVTVVVLAGRRVQARAYGGRRSASGRHGAGVGVLVLAVVALLALGVGRVAVVAARSCPPPPAEPQGSASPSASPGGRPQGEQPPPWPGEGEWDELPTAGLRGRQDHTAVWTGEHMLVWGGQAPHPEPGVTARFADGAAYDPDRDTWHQLAPAPLAPRAGHTAVWTGEELLVWGGQAGCRGPEVAGDGAAYDPATDSWRELADAPLTPRAGHTAVWTGEEMLVWGGFARPAAWADNEPLADGAAYDPDSDTWRTLAEAPLHATGDHTAVWTGEHMLVLGGHSGGPTAGASLDAALYSPAERQWERLSRNKVLGARRHAPAVWTGERVLVDGRPSLQGPTVVAYDPQADRWQALPDPPHTARTALWTSRELILWTGNSTHDHPAGSAYHPDTEQWRMLPDPPQAQPPTAVWTGQAMITWGGVEAADTPQDTLRNTGAIYQPPPSPQ